MPPIGLGLLAILILSAAFIGLVDLTGVPVNFASRVSGGAALLLGVAAISLLGSARGSGTKPTDHSMLAYAMACAIASFAIIIALAAPVQALIVLGVVAAWVLIWWPGSMRRLSTTTSVVIARDPEIVFGFLSDFRTQLRYLPGVASVEKLTDGPIGVGTQFRARARTRTGMFEAVEQITDYEPNTRYASSVVSSKHPNTGTVTFEAVAGGTRATFRYGSELSHSTALLGMGLLRWRLQRRLIAQRTIVWARVKQILESETQPNG